MPDIIITHDGKKYRLIKDAHCADLAYEAYAICLQDNPDDDGYQPLYELYWHIKDQYIDFDRDTGSPYLSVDCPDGESLLVDWEHPSGVIYAGDYNVKTGDWC